MYQSIKTIDAHVHLTSLLFPQDIKEPKENVLDGDCVKECLRAMDRHGIDQCLALVGQGISILPKEADMMIKMAEALPERIAGVMVGISQPQDEPWNYDPEKAAEELDGFLKNPVVKGLGELAICAFGYMADWPEVWDRMRPMFEVLAQHHAPCLFHTGASPQFPLPEELRSKEKRPKSKREVYFSNPLLIDDIAAEYPEVPLIIGHAGVQGFFYYGSYADMALTLAARHQNVYIETSSVPYEVLLKCVEEPAIGPEKLIFGTDSPAFYGYYRSPSRNEYYPSYGKTGPGNVMTDHYQYDLENIQRLPITDVQRQMIMGGTIAQIIGQKQE